MVRIKSILFLTIILLLSANCSKDKQSDEAGNKMQDFVISISNYAKAIDPGFIVIPQNGIELAFNNTEPNDGLNMGYLNAVDGFGVEELFYNGTYTIDNYRLSMLQQIKTTEKVLVSEFVAHNIDIQEAYTRNYTEDFICFVRAEDNYNYYKIPDNIFHSNATNIASLSDVQNYLYLISNDNFESKNGMINAISEKNFDLVLIDLFYDGDEFTREEVNLLKTKPNGSQRLVIAYMSLGSAENYRYYWQTDWRLNHPSWIKKKYEGYDDEYWVEFWEKEWQDIIYGSDSSYLNKIINAGFDGVYLDNVEAYYFLYHND
ncbi:MAG: hypothetical protein CVU14_02580 [Bacteroidetes bacterium HGW-Bacteroidetes-9]|nr:MAG: hypothetical protein CVU14_02580 [Bacteroidetes bacterium HGW-Bacteroidetes-9]